MAIIGIQL